MAPVKGSYGPGSKGKKEGAARRRPDFEPGIDYTRTTSYPKRTTSGRVSVGSSFRGAVDRILNRGIVIDAWMSFSALGLRVLDIEADVVVSSLETYIKYADALGATCPADAKGAEERFRASPALASSRASLIFE